MVHRIAPGIGSQLGSQEAENGPYLSDRVIEMNRLSPSSTLAGTKTSPIVFLCAGNKTVFPIQQHLLVTVALKLLGASHGKGFR